MQAQTVMGTIRLMIHDVVINVVVNVVINGCYYRDIQWYVESNCGESQ